MKDEIRNIETDIEVSKQKATIQKQYVDTLEDNKKLKIKRQKEKLTRLYAFTRADETALYDACDKLGYDDLKDFIAATELFS